MISPFSDNELIAMLHIPVDSILAAPREWKERQGLPSPTSEDWIYINDLMRCHNYDNRFVQDIRTLEVIENQCKSLSFYPYLEQRMLKELACYVENGIKSVMIENIAAPYFSRESIPGVISGVMGCLAESLVLNRSDCTLGIQILAFGDDQAMQIAVRKGLDFIRTESALFEGVRPEGRTPNQGNLATLYMMREILAAECGCTDVPFVIVDLKKKHTVFPKELDNLNVWLDTISFEKLEGVIITGESTGKAVEESDLINTNRFIKELAAENRGCQYSCPLFVGSGVTIDSIEACRKYANGVIVGSAFKKDGFWENEVDPRRVAEFMKVWNQ